MRASSSGSRVGWLALLLLHAVLAVASAIGAAGDPEATATVTNTAEQPSPSPSSRSSPPTNVSVSGLSKRPARGKASKYKGASASLRLIAFYHARFTQLRAKKEIALSTTSSKTKAATWPFLLLTFFFSSRPPTLPGPPPRHPFDPGRAPLRPAPGHGPPAEPRR